MAFAGEELLEGLQEPFRSQIVAMINASGGRLYVKSGYRSHERQKQLWAEALRKYGDPEVADNWVARPGTSNHEHGWAVDLGYATPDAKEWAHNNAGQFGLLFPLSNEDWHIEFAGNRNGDQGQMGSITTSMPWQGGIMYNLNYADPTAVQNPQEVLANRLHSMLSIIGLDPASAGPGTSVIPQADPTMDVLQETPEIEAPGEAVPDAGARLLQARRMGGMVDQEVPVFGGVTGLGGLGGGSAPPLGAGMPADPHGYGAYAKQVAQKYGWDDNDFLAWVALGNEESGTGKSDTHIVAWDPNASNPTSTAYGIGQFLDSTWSTVGGTKTSDPFRQIDYMAEYISRRYKNPRNALDFHHRNNWY